MRVTWSARSIMAAADAFDFEIVKNTRAKSDIWRYFGLKKRKLDQQIEEHVAVCRECHATVRLRGISRYVSRYGPPYRGIPRYGNSSWYPPLVVISSTISYLLCQSKTYLG